MTMYSYRQSIKSDKSDELINTYILRPFAGLIVGALYYTPITPNQVTLASTIAGLVAACLYLKGTPDAFIAAGLLVTLKDILDSADGQLARAKRQFSRIGRFLDSIGDFIVDVALFSAIGWRLYQATGNEWMPVLALLGLMGITLRVSYHVFYHVNFLHLQNQYANNRVTEEIREEDRAKGGIELTLQRIFQLIYGWQDRLIKGVDAWSRKNHSDVLYLQKWYADLKGLTISGFLGFGTELFLLMVCSVVNQLEVYLYLNIFLMNGIMVLSVLYRRVILFRILRKNLS
jgi:phosphatidylglycerophosphate synthase